MLRVYLRHLLFEAKDRMVFVMTPHIWEPTQFSGTMIMKFVGTRYLFSRLYPKGMNKIKEYVTKEKTTKTSLQLTRCFIKCCTSDNRKNMKIHRDNTMLSIIRLYLLVVLSLTYCWNIVYLTGLYLNIFIWILISCFTKLMTLLRVCTDIYELYIIEVVPQPQRRWSSPCIGSLPLALTAYKTHNTVL